MDQQVFVAPTSPAQRRLWLIHQMETGRTLYNIASYQRLEGPVDAALLRRSLEIVTERHEALRTTFAPVDGEPMQLVAPQARVALPVVDLAALPAPRRPDEARRLAAAERGRRFDLARPDGGLLLRVRLLRLGPARHRLVLVIHHIVFDGWSAGVLLGELRTLYGALARGEEPALPEVPIQYADYAEWRLERLTAPVVEGHLEFWREHLAGAPTILDLPFDRPRGARPPAGAAEAVALPASLAERLVALAAGEGGTAFSGLAALFALWLRLHTGHDDLVIGWPVAGRDRPELEGLLGLFVDTLVLRVRLDPEQSFRDLVGRVSREVAACLAHQELPFDRLVEDLVPERLPGVNPLFQAMLVVQHGGGGSPGGSRDPRDLDFQAEELPGGAGPFDLTLELAPEEGALAGRFEYRADLFDRTTVRRFAARLVDLAARALERPDTPLRRLGAAPMAAAERHALLVEWSHAPARLPPPGRAPAPGRRPETFPELLGDVASRRPDGVALCWPAGGAAPDGERGEERMTYAELRGAVRDLARRLREEAAGAAGPGQVAALFLDRSAEAVVAILAVLEAGAAYLPLDPAYPDERLAFMLRDSGARLVVTRRELAPRLEALIEGGAEGGAGEGTEGLATLLVDPEGAEGFEGGVEDDRRPAALPEAPAYVIYTSGSTGRPKGVQVSHRNLLSTARALAERYAIGRESRLLQVAPLSFDASVAEIFPTLLAGGTLCLEHPDELLPGPALARTLAERRISHVTLVPPALAALPESPLPELRVLVVAGEACPAELAFRWRLGRLLINAYGPTEATVCAAAGTVTGEAPGRAAQASPPIGRPVPGSRVWVADSALEPAPVGVPGELVIGGAGVSQGYRGRPAATAERFVPDPFPGGGGDADGVGGRLYRTGDLAVWLADGRLLFLGRIDRQIKVRGFRIEPAEIEAALAAHPAVAEAVADARAAALGPALLAAWVVPAGEPPAPDELRRFLRERLPDHMVPSLYAVLDELPLTPAGKVDRRALPDPAPGAGGVERTAPRTPVEEVLAEIWSEVLGVDAAGGQSAIGVDDDFFALGGHSLLASRVIARVRKALGVELPVAALFEAPTVAALAGRVARLADWGADGGGEAPPLEPVTDPAPGADGRRELPLSFAQQRLWLLDRLEPGSPLYNVPMSYRLAGPVDRGALAGALDDLASRHESLRTAFAERGDRPVQVVAPARPGRRSLPVIDLSRLPAAPDDRVGPRGAEAERLAAGWARRPIDLDGGGDDCHGALWRSALLTLAPDDHRLLVTVHHAVFDGWSAGVFAVELDALYGERAGGRPAELPRLPLQYGDYAVWQRRALSDEVARRELALWRRELDGVPESLELPTDRPRPAVRSPRGGRASRDLPPELALSLRALGRREGATPFMTLLAGFVALLGRLTGAHDLAVGTPVAGRERPELERLIGFFVNTLVLRADLAGSPGFRELLGRMRRRSLTAFAHQELPFDRLVEALAPERDRSRNPLVQVMFTVEGVGRSAGAPSGLLVPEEQGPGTATAKFDLTLTIAPGRDGALSAGLEYSAELFDATTAERLLGHLERLLAAAVAEPDRPVAELALLSPRERHQLLAEWSWRPGPDLPELTVHEVVRSWAEGTPDAVAVVSGDEHLTYAELVRRADRLAAELVAVLGGGSGAPGRAFAPGTPVGLAVERSAELVVAILGILRAGASYLPLDSAYPTERLAFMLEDSGLSVLVTAGALDERLPLDRSRVRVVRLEEVGRAGAGGSVSGPAAGPDDPCYVMYTSGSTGRPKGVPVPHRGVVRLVRDAGYLRFGPEETVLQFAPISFDASTIEIWGALVNGGRLWVQPAGPASVGELAAGIEARRATSVFLTTGLFHQLAQQGDPATELARLGSVRWLATGGDTASAEACRRVLAALPGTVLGNAYGPTENSSVTTGHRMASTDDVAEPVPIGRPIPHTSVQVVDPALRPVPIGVAGELVTGGAGVARGYLGRPALTAERFVPDPFAALADGAGSPGRRLYRTGDLARWRSDGTIEFLGRIDHQVKVRGFRIEPGEVEDALARHPSVAEAVVVARPVPAGGKALVAYVVGAHSGPEPDPGALRDHLAARLPSFMVPAEIVALAALPLGASGKVDRRALPEPAWGRGAGGPDAPPESPTEQAVAAVFSDVLGFEAPVGLHDDFFRLGGHSLAAARVVARLRDALQVELPLARVFEAPTVAGLATAVEEALRATVGGGTGATLPPLEAEREPETEPAPDDPRGTLRVVAPVSFAQERLVFLDRWQPEAPAYNLPVVYRLAGALDAAALGRSLRRVAERQESLRTTFDGRGETPRQVIAPRARLPLPVVDLAGLPAPLRHGEAARVAARESRRPFDLARGPLVRATLVRLGGKEIAVGGEEHRLVLVLHHIVSDGWSMAVLEEELATFYRLETGRDPVEGPPAPLPVQYRDFARWQRSWLRDEALEAQLAYWRERLADPPTVELPADRPRPPAPTFGGRLLRTAYPAATARGLDALGRRRGTTRFMTVLAAFAALVARWTGTDDLVIGSPVANRRRSELEGLVGFFVNTLALRLDLSGDPTFRELLARVRRSALGAYVHQDLPFERLVEALQVERDPSRNPVFQVMLSVDEEERGSGRSLGPDLEMTSVPVDAGIAKFDLTLFVRAAEGELSATAEYATDLFDGPTVGRLLGHLGTLAAAAAESPEVPLSGLPLLAPAERHQLLIEWGADTGWAGAAGAAEDAQVGEPACLHELFRTQAAKTPEAEALVARRSDGAGGATEERLTYRELAERSAAVAGRLRALGAAGPGSGGLAPREARVGVCAARTADMVAALLGVLEAGGVYVPLDPAYPRERLVGMLEDSGAVAILADRPHLGLAQELAQELAGSAPGAPEVVALEEAVAAPPSAPAPPSPTLGPTPGNLAYLIYTSGSTGRPKGVAIEHRSAAALVAWSRRVFRDEELAGVAAVTSISFDLSVFEIFVPLARGGRVILAADALALPDTPGAAEVTLLNTVPSSAAELERAGTLPPGAATVNLAGEPLQGELVERLIALPGVRRVLNLYGPSEDTTYSTWCDVASASGSGERREPTIGRAVTGTRAWVVDRTLGPVPIGVPGELLLGGAGLARGYLGRGALTAERWIPDPFGPTAGGGPGGRLYRTGDLVRTLPDGRLDFLGRLDHQVKLRGFRIELGEVEAALAAHPLVAEAVAGVRAPGGPKMGAEAGAEAEDRRLVAWVVPAPGASAGTPGAAGGEDLADRLRQDLARTLPAYMVPSAFVELGELPRSPNGKVDRKALPDPEPAAGTGGGGAPRNPLEEALAGLWSELLRLPSVGVHDDFFRLGGHSLLAMRAVARVRGLFGVEIPLRTLFEGPTVAEVAREVEEALAGRGAEPLPPIEPVPREDGAARLPLSASQEQLWFLDRLEPGDPSFNLPTVVRLVGDLDPPALGRALAGVVARHEPLRTRFVADGGAPRQVIGPPGPVPLPVVDLGGLPEGQGGSAGPREAEARRLAAAEGRRGFDLASFSVASPEPLLRAVLVRMGRSRDGGGAEHLFLLTVHHIASDARSQDVLMGDLEELYDAARAGRPPALARQALQYADYAVWQRRTLRGDALEERLAYWRERLGGELPRLALPGEPAESAKRRGGRQRLGEVRMRSLEGEPLERLRSLDRERGATLFMGLLAAFAALLHRLTGTTDLLVGTPSANRGRSEIEDLVGFFVNTLVLRTDLAGDPTFRELLDRVRDEALGAYAHGDLPFETLVAALQPERSSGGAPLFRVMFAANTIQHRGGEGRRFADLELEPLIVHNGTSQFDLSVYAVDRGPSVELYAEYDAELFGTGGGDGILDQLRRLLEEALADPDRRLSELAPWARLELPDRGAPDGTASEGPRAGEAEPAPVPTGGAATSERKERLAARRAQLSAAQREALDRRLRGARVGTRGTPGSTDRPAGGGLTGTGRPAGGGLTGTGRPVSGPCLVPLQPTGARAPLFLVHPAGGDVLCFGPLAEAVGRLSAGDGGRPVYGLQSRGLVEGAEAHATIEEMAAAYLEEARRVQPEGPLHLAGWSLGGVVAFEMACQARRASGGRAAPGRQGLVAVVDTVPGIGDLLPADLEGDDARWLMHIVEYAEGLSGRRLGITYETLTGLPLEAQLARLGGGLGAAGLLPPAGAGSSGPARYLARLLQVFKANCRALGRYRPGTLPGRLVLFRAAEEASPDRPEAPDLGWAGHTSEPVAVETVPGTHITLLAEPNVRTFAGRLVAWLERAQIHDGGGAGPGSSDRSDPDGAAPAAPRSET